MDRPRIQTIELTCDRPVRTDAEALDAVCASLRLHVIEEIRDGGSSARVYLTADPDGNRLVVKTLVAEPGVVDGHDLGSFLQKRVQIDAIRRQAPALGGRYLDILHSIQGDGWAAYTTRHYPSHDQAAPLREPGCEAAFFEHYEKLADDLFVRGYGSHRGPAPADFIERVVIGRVLRRWPLLQHALPDAVSADRLIVNGRACVSARLLLPELLSRQRAALEQMAPPRLGLGAHGDANTRNVLVGADGDFRLIDPRGSTDAWDPVYDLAKTLFCLTVWEPALRLGFDIRRDSDGRTPSFTVGFRRPNYPGYRWASGRLLPFLAALPGLSALFAGDAGWQSRLLLTHALHVLAEAPCRLSDRKPRLGCDGQPSSPVELALGHYLLGTWFVNDLADQLAGHGELAAETHLALSL